MNDYLITQKIVSSEGIVQEVNVYKILTPIVIDTTTNFTVLELKCEKIS